MSDITLAISENAIKRLFEKKIKTSPSIEKADRKNFKYGSIAYHIKCHFTADRDTKIDLETNANTTEGKKDIIRVRELDIIWEKLFFEFTINISPQCVGGGCIDLPWPFPDICYDAFCIFEADPDVRIPLDLPAKAINSEVSGSLTPNTRRVPAPEVPPGSPPKYPQWQIRLHAIEPFDVDLFDPAGFLSRLFEAALKRIIDDIFGGIPGWAKDLLWWLIGDPIIWILKNVLDIGDDLQEWLQRIIGRELGIENFIASRVVRTLDDFVIHEMDDPYKIIDAEIKEDVIIDPEVRINISAIGIAITPDELVVNVDVK